MLNPSVIEKQKTKPPRMLRTDPAQPMNRAAPSSNLNADRTNTLVDSTHNVKIVLKWDGISYFCFTNNGSKNSDVILCAYREQAVIEQSPAKTLGVKILFI